MGKTRRKKKRTHTEDDNSTGIGPKPPQTFVMERGRVGRLLHELIVDLRQTMEPFTASQLKVTRRNILKDFVHIAGPLGVTHFIMISKTNEHVNLKISKLPRGPTITFHVTQFSLAREVIAAASKPPPLHTNMFVTPAMLVLNNFSLDNKPTKLMMTMFQNMFPTLNLQTVKLANMKRCVLWNYNKDSQQIEFRHYGIKVVPRGVSRGVRKIAQSRIPNLSRYEDISEYVLGGGASESEAEEAEGEVTLAQDVPGRGNIKQQQSAVKLYELGPRLTLQLVKIEAGLCSGEVLHHEFIQKTSKEMKQLRKLFKERRQLKLVRKREQEENVKRKEKEKERKKKEEHIRQGITPLVEEERGSDSDDDAEYYRQEVGVAPDPELSLTSRPRQPLVSGQKRKKRTAPDFSKSRGPPLKRTKLVTMETKGKTKKFQSSKRDSKDGTKPVKKIYTGTVFRKKANRK